MTALASIKPIETVYKGYRFRSRLEARWAVFFDELGIKWGYETQGYDLYGERYLPDFYLPELKTFVEVKSEHLRSGYAPPAIYMAGRMGQNDYREIDISGCWHFEESISPQPLFWRGNRINYCGPFAVDEKAHTNEHGNGMRELVYKRSISGIDQCDVFFAYLGDVEAYGTLVEIGYAAALGKQIILGVDDILRFEGSENSEVKDVWFATYASSIEFYGNKAAILCQLAKWLDTIYAPPREIRLAQALAEGSGEAVFLSYGDPVESLKKGWITFGVSQLGVVLKRLPCRDLDKAASAARQARFEYGQSGAR